MKILSLLAATLLLLSCDTEIQEAISINDDLLINCWIHAHEEDPADDIDLYIVCDANDLPISRFRKTIDLRSDGTATYLVLSPIDAHYTEEGSWNFDLASQTLEILNADGKIHLSQTVVLLNDATVQLSESQ